MILRFLALPLTILLLSCTTLDEEYDTPYDATMTSSDQDDSIIYENCLIDINQCVSAGSKEERYSCRTMVLLENRRCEEVR